MRPKFRLGKARANAPRDCTCLFCDPTVSASVSLRIYLQRRDRRDTPARGANCCCSVFRGGPGALLFLLSRSPSAVGFGELLAAQSAHFRNYYHHYHIYWLCARAVARARARALGANAFDLALINNHYCTGRQGPVCRVVPGAVAGGSRGRENRIDDVVSIIASDKGMGPRGLRGSARTYARIGLIAPR